MNQNLGFLSRGWMGRWLATAMNGAIVDRLDRLERQVYISQQENIALRQQLNAGQDQFQALSEQIQMLEQQCVQFLLEPEDKQYKEVERQLSRVWQYYQDAKGQFEKMNRQILQQKTTLAESDQKFRKQISQANALHRSEIRDLKQQFDQLAFSLQGHRPIPAPDRPNPETLS